MAACRPILTRFLRYGAGQCTRTREVRRQCRLGHCRLSSSAAATAELDIIDVSPALHAGSSACPLSDSFACPPRARAHMHVVGTRTVMHAMQLAMLVGAVDSLFDNVRTHIPAKPKL